MTPQEILKLLDERATQGLDLSPGDELCAEAAKLIRELQEDAWKYQELCK